MDIYCSKEIEDPDNFLNTTSEDYNIEAKGSRNKSGVKPHLKAGINQSAKQSGKVYVISTEFESPSALTHLKG